MHYYPHHIGDFLKDTSHLTNEQMAVYLRMIWSYYASEKPLEDDCERIAFAVRSDAKTVSLILCHFFCLEGGSWHHKRCDEVIAEFRAKSEKSRGSANARWEKAKAMRTHSERNADERKIDANQEPITNNQEPVINTPIPPRGAVGLEAWLEALKASGQKPIPEDDPVFAYAEQVGLPHDYLRLAWLEFRARYSDGSKRYKDWRSVFRKAVRGNWFRLWYSSEAGFSLTTVGIQAQRAHQRAA